MTKAYNWIDYHARQTPEHLAQVDLHSGRRYTYAAMAARVERLAGALAALGVERGERVAMLASNTTDCMDTEFACMKLGAVYVPLNWRLAVPELEFILGDCAPRVLIHEDIFADAAEHVGASVGIAHLLELNGAGTESSFEYAIARAAAHRAQADLTHDDLWTIMYTSGTTGHPKGAMITYGMAFWNVVNMLNPFCLSPDIVNLCLLPLFHTGGLNCFANPAMHLGGSNYVLRAFDAAATLRHLQDPEQGITHIIGVPANYLFMSQLPEFESADLSGVKVCGVGGAPTPLELMKIYAAKGKALQNAFGMTETSPLIAGQNAASAKTKIGSVGMAALHTEIRIVDESGTDVSGPGTVGELWVKGPNVTPGYWNRPQANAESFTDGWLHTGDAAHLDEDGYLYVVDRWKDMYISGGENVYPAEVENVIYQLDAVAEVAVIGVPDERWGEVGQAVVVVKPGRALDEAAVLRHCAERLARFKQPRTVRFVDDIPHNATGKMLKRELRAAPSR